MNSRLAVSLRSPVFWLLACVFAVEFFLFDQYGARRHTAIYPRWHDQIQYLGDSYTGYEFARSRGVIAGLLNALTNPSAQGTLHDFFAIIVFYIAGPSRSAALSLNMLATVAWQAAAYLSVARSYGSRPLAVATAMLPLALIGPWQNIPGSAYDFRLDHLAMCAIGITAASAVLADGFCQRRRSSWFGIAAGLTVLTRFLTGTYFVLIFAAFAGWIFTGTNRKQRLLKLSRAAVIASLIAVPILWINYDAVRGYYSMDPYFGPESAIRNPNLGLYQSLRFISTHLAQRHVGMFFGLLAAGGTVALALLRRRTPAPIHGHAWIVGGVFLLSPLVVLTLHPQKSEVLAGALAPGIITLAIATWGSAARRASPRAASIVAGAVILVTLGFFARAQTSQAYSPSAQTDIRQVNTIADRIFTRALAAELRPPRVAVDHITEALDGQALRVIGYERKRVWLPFEMTLPTGIAAPADALVMERLAQSDFVFLTEAAPDGSFPFDRKLAAMRPQLHAWCEANLRPAERFVLFGRRMVLYQRREIPFP